jgi:hypothetical protein
MENQETESSPKRRLKKKAGLAFSLPVFLVAVSLLGGYYLFFSESSQRLRPQASSPAVVKQTLAASSANSPVAKQEQDTEVASGVTSTSPDTNQESTSTNLSQGSAEISQVKLIGAPPVIPSIDEACLQLADNVELFFDVIDTRDYMQQFNIEEKSSIYFPRLIQKLVDNPPIVSGETDDLFTILQNTAHFFRILGKKNILILKGILDRERDTFEQTLSDFYALTKEPACLKERFGLTIDKEPLYQYAGFFINTMGGRLYLFRRDSMSRMVVSYYAIITIDQANREGRNRYGVEISTAIDSLINEIESSRIKLQMRDRYLDGLYSLKEKYQ